MVRGKIKPRGDVVTVYKRMRGRAVLGLLALVGAASAADPREALPEAVRLHQAGEFEAAAAKYEPPAKAYPEIAEIRSNLSAVYAAPGRYDDAVGEHEAALAARPDLPGARLNLGLAYFKSGRPALAATELEKVLQAGENRQALRLPAESRLNLGRYDGVVELLAERTAEVAEDDVLAYALGSAYIRRGDVAQGRPLIDRLFRRGETPLALMLPASAQTAAGEYAAARDGLARAVELNPRTPGVRAAYGNPLLATVYYRLKRKADGDRQREIVRRLNAERQARQPGAVKAAEQADERP